MPSSTVVSKERPPNPFGRGGTSPRKGLYVVGFDIEPRSAFTPLFRYSIAFNHFRDQATNLADFETIYATRNASGFTRFGTNIKADSPWTTAETLDQTWVTTNETDGPDDDNRPRDSRLRHFRLLMASYTSCAAFNGGSKRSRLISIPGLQTMASRNPDILT